MPTPVLYFSVHVQHLQMNSRTYCLSVDCDSAVTLGRLEGTNVKAYSLHPGTCMCHTTKLIAHDRSTCCPKSLAPLQCIFSSLIALAVLQHIVWQLIDILCRQVSSTLPWAGMCMVRAIWALQQSWLLASWPGPGLSPQLKGLPLLSQQPSAQTLRPILVRLTLDPNFDC